MPAEIGQEAPDFELRDNRGELARLSDFRGKKAVVLVFYPYALSPTCTGELCALRDDLETYVNDDTQLLGISIDHPYALARYAEDQGYTFPLLADFWPHGAVAKAYGCFNEDVGTADRATYVIDKDGIVRWSVLNGRQARDQTAYAEALAEITRSS